MTEQGVGVVRPLPGDGLIAHVGGLLLVCDAAGAVAEELVAAVEETAATGGDGRALARRAAQVLARSMTAEPIACALAGRVGDGVAVLVSGAAQAMAAGPGGELRLDGTDALTWTDRMVRGPVSRVELRLPGAGQPFPRARLDAGVVSGGGVVCDYDASGAPMSAGPAHATRAAGPAPHHQSGPPPHQAGPPQHQAGPPQQGPGPAPVHAPQGHPGMGSAPVPAPHPGAGHGPGPAPHGGPGTGPQGPGPAPYPSGPQGPAPYTSGPQPVGPPSGHMAPPDYEPRPAPDPRPAEPSGHQAPASGPMAPPEYDHGPVHTDPGGTPASGGAGGQGDRQGEQPPFESFLLIDQPGDDGEPESILEPTELGQAPEPPSRPMVYGVDCKNDHFNDPRVPYCAVCGIALVQRTLVPYKGERPPLGVLLLDDGMTLNLETDYLLGRDPERAPEVTSGEARPARVTSPDGSVSRRHLRVRLDGWDVNLIDLGSVNGTQVQPPGDPNFYDIPANEPVPVLPGTTVRIGVSRTMRYESHRNA